MFPCVPNKPSKPIAEEVLKVLSVISHTSFTPFFAFSVPYSAVESCKSELGQNQSLETLPKVFLQVKICVMKGCSRLLSRTAFVHRLEFDWGFVKEFNLIWFPVVSFFF